MFLRSVIVKSTKLGVSALAGLGQISSLLWTSVSSSALKAGDICELD